MSECVLCGETHEDRSVRVDRFSKHGEEATFSVVCFLCAWAAANAVSDKLTAREQSVRDSRNEAQLREDLASKGGFWWRELTNTMTESEYTCGDCGEFFGVGGLEWCDDAATRVGWFCWSCHPQTRSWYRE